MLCFEDWIANIITYWSGPIGRKNERCTRNKTTTKNRVSELVQRSSAQTKRKSNNKHKYTLHLCLATTFFLPLFLGSVWTQSCQRNGGFSLSTASCRPPIPHLANRRRRTHNFFVSRGNTICLPIVRFNLNWWLFVSVVDVDWVSRYRYS